MDVVVSHLSSADGAEFVQSVRASRTLHHPWLDPPDTEERFEAYLEHASREDQAAFVIRHTVCGGLVGYVGVSNIVRRAFCSAHLGYGAFAPHGGRGLMAEGLQAVLGRAFGELRLHRVEANIQPGNARSIALAHRLGFEREGYSPRYLMVDGDWRDHERWALRVETWRPGPAPLRVGGLR